MSVLIIPSQIYLGAVLFQMVGPAFVLRMNKDHGTDCNLCKLHVCLQLYFTYSIYHLQTIPQRNMYRTFEKETEIWRQSVFLSFVSDAAGEFAGRVEALCCAYSVLSCSSRFSFVLSAFTRRNCGSWNDITAIKQREREKTLQKTVQMRCNHGILIKCERPMCFHISLEKENHIAPSSLFLSSKKYATWEF